MHRASLTNSIRSRAGRWAALALAPILLSVPSCVAPPELSPDPATGGPAYITRQHDLLEALVGEFELAGWSQRDPFGMRLDFVGRATGRFVLDGLFTEVTVRGRLGDEDYEALYLVGYDTTRGRYQVQTLSSWQPVIGEPATGSYDEDTRELTLQRSGSELGQRGASAMTVFTFVDADTWTLDRYDVEWEPRRWSNVRATRIGAPPVEIEASAPADADPDTASR